MDLIKHQSHRPMTNPLIEPALSTSAKLAPPAGVVGAKLAGIPLADWVQWMTLLYMVMLIVHKGWLMLQDARAALRERQAAQLGTAKDRT